MLTITDLSRNEELSAANMGKLAGGEDKLCDSGCGNGSKADADPSNGSDVSSSPQSVELLGYVCMWLHFNIPGL
jgi:hypothetical protein